MSSAFPAREFAKVAFPAGRPGVFLMLQAYFDDSGTHAGSEIVIWAGAYGDTECFEQFEREWQAMLDAPLPGKPPLQKFSLSDCRYSEGEFKSYKPPERDALRYRAREIIKESGVRSFAYCVPTKFWKLVPGRVRRAYGGADVLAFGACADRVISASRLAGGAPVACVFDKGQKSDLFETVCKEAERRASEKGISISYTFGAVKDHLGLQAADTIATQHYWQTLEFLAGNFPSTDPHFLSMMKMNNPDGLVFGRREAELLKREFLKQFPLRDHLRKPVKWVGSRRSKRDLTDR